MTNAYDLNTAEVSSYQLIPDKTAVKLKLHILKDNGSILRTSQAGNEMLKLEFIPMEGQFKGRSFKQLFVTGGHEKASNITRQIMRAIVESAKNITPDDATPQAQEARRLSGWGDLEGLVFAGTVVVEMDDQGYQHNRLKRALTPNEARYAEIMGQGIPPTTPAPDNSLNPQQHPSAPSNQWG